MSATHQQRREFLSTAFDACFLLNDAFRDLIQLPGLFCVFWPFHCIQLAKCIHMGFLCERD